jgi:hypothetical protein
MGKEEVDAAITALEATGRSIDNWVLICAVGVAISLGAEVVFSVAHWLNEKKLIPVRAEQVRLHTLELAGLSNSTAEAKKETARLSVEAETAKSEIAAANKKASEAQERTETERLLRIKLEQQVAPRRFGPENLKEASRKLAGLAGQPAHVTSYSLDLESGLFAGQIIECLKNAGLVVTDNRSSILPMGGFSIGVHISGSDKKAVEEIALVLWAFSNAVVKIDAAPSPLQGQDAATSPISILVGTKPIDAPAGGIVVGPDDKILIPPIGTVEQK